MVNPVNAKAVESYDNDHEWTQDEFNKWLRQKMKEDGLDFNSVKSTGGTHDEKYVGNANQNSNTSGNSSSNSTAAEPTPAPTPAQN